MTPLNALVVWVLGFLFVRASPLYNPLPDKLQGKPSESSVQLSVPPAPLNAGEYCFPSLGFQMPSSPPSHTRNWWCDPKTEYAFLGFSYEVTACE
jgi:hypothetical protein